MAKRKRKVWGGLKKGDTAIEVCNLGEKGRETVSSTSVVSVGPRWITTQGRNGGPKTRYDRETGYGDFGSSLHTQATLANKRERIELRRRWLVAGVGLEEFPTDLLRQIVTTAESLREAIETRLRQETGDEG